MAVPSQAPINSNLAAALAHAARGRPVFPCDNKNKRPAIPKSQGGNGFKDATCDALQIHTWWARYPNAVPGMPTGAKTGVFVLDVDSKSGKVGDDTLVQLLAAFGPLPDTLETITATGGRHIYFRHPRGSRIVPNSASQLGHGGQAWDANSDPAVPFERAPGGQLITPDLDIRGDGGYVIMPGSIMADGRRYEWEGSSDPDEGAELANAPDWLLGLVIHDPRAVRPTVASTEAAVGQGRRNDFLYRLGCSLRAKGLGEAAIIAALQAENSARCDPPLSPAEVDATARSAATKAPGPPDLRIVGGSDFDARPEVALRAGELPLAVDAVEDHLIRMGSDIYQHGTRLVRVGQWDSATGAKKTAIERPTGAGVLVDISPDWLIDQCTRHINFQRFDKRSGDYKSVDCPGRVAATLVARSGSWRFPVLTGFCDSPTLDLDGRIVSAPGYDSESGLYLAHPPVVDVPMPVGHRDAQGAGETLYSAIDTFPFVSSADASACMAMIMTALFRRVLPAAPIGCVSAATPGTGKSLLVDVISALACGRQAAVMALGHTPEELEKRLDSVLLKGDVLCSFDNVDRPVRSDVLCQVATQPVKSIRVLQVSKVVEAPTNVAIFMTGNNLTMLGDLVRRCVVVNLDAGCERPELREFDRDAVEYALSRRAEFIGAALAISKGYLDAGCPKVDAAPFGSFPAWDRMIRRALIWGGWKDPLRPAEALRDQDHELAGLRDLLTAWRSVHKEPLTASELLELIRAKLPDIGDRWRPQYPDLTEAAIQVMGDLPKWGARELGYRLRAQHGRLFGPLRIAKADKTAGGIRWFVESISEGNGV